MGIHFILLSIAIMVLASTIVCVTDSSPLQDFCVAVNDSKSAVGEGIRMEEGIKMEVGKGIGIEEVEVEFNEGKSNAIALSGLSSQNPDVITVANAVFGSNPKIYVNVLAKEFQVDKKVVDNLQTQFWWPNN
ncbi:germin-like protein subfamily 1 member 7 [Camellia sinensis]|uniref:germin-like protein subfamily 1 member 7 n=1 Tax=Camellia sinensis TaxID=4442 RepID=UPI0010364F2D|nr:germin-like protein subfamily 1 member 7 [Camellia sinensis]